MAAIGILGAGTWGIALARMLCNAGHSVTVWTAEPAKADELAAERKQKDLPGMTIPGAVGFTKEMEEACAQKDIIVFAVSSPYVRATARRAAPYIGGGQVIADAAKGMEAETLMTLSEVIRDELQKDVRVAALSGPTHAEEVAQDLPTTIVAACEDERAAAYIQTVFTNPVMRIYTNTDIKGVELCGALKNIIALATGIAAGLGYGDNTKAALITRGLAEIRRLGLKMGCEPETFSGLAGMGDLIVTATSRHSRNNRCGYLIGQGCTAAEAAARIGMAVEGINAIPAAIRLAEKYNVEMPIVQTADGIVNRGKDPREAVRELMGRDSKAELSSPAGERR